MSEAATLPSRFSGLWSIRRHIFDITSQWTGRFDGEGRFIPDEAGMRYREDGRLRFGGLQDVAATRTYLYRFPDPARVEVRFEDGRFFHAFDPRGPVAEADHLCDADLYEVRYVFEADAAWRAEWRVEGPRKAYRMVTYYRRPYPG